MYKIDEYRKEIAGNILKSFSSENNLEKGHNVGDVHPNGKWVWTEYSPGKFDWRNKKKEDDNIDKSLYEQAKTTSTETLKNVLKSTNEANKKLKEVAKQELERREKKISDLMNKNSKKIEEITNVKNLDEKFLRLLPELNYTEEEKKGCYYVQKMPLIGKTGTINFDKTGDRWMFDWYKRYIVYHEGGHAIGDNFKIEVGDLDFINFFSKWKNVFSDDDIASELDNKIYKSIEEKIKRKYNVDYNKTFDSEHEKFLFLIDLKNLKRDDSDYQKFIIDSLNLSNTLQAFNLSYGYGHKKSYFWETFHQKNEILAHCIENKFLGNAAFESLAPELYEESIEIANKIIEKYS